MAPRQRTARVTAPENPAGCSIAGPTANIGYLLRLCFLALLMMWPAFANGQPFFFSDTLSYLKGGEYAMDVLFSDFVDTQTSDNGGRLAADNVQTVQQSPEKNEGISGARSPIYSVALFLLSAPNYSLFLLIGFQALAVAFLVLTLFQLYSISQNLKFFFAVSTFVAFATSASWFASYAMPDLFTGAAILATAILASKLECLTVSARIALVAIIAFSVAAHASNPPLVLSLVCAGALMVVAGRMKNLRSTLIPIIWLCAPLALGILATTASNLIGFGEASVVAKRYPIALARSIEDGPARWHLEENCDRYNYAVCEVYDEIPKTVQAFLWQSNGLADIASAEQMDRIREEEALILQRAAQDYPMASVRKAYRNFSKQLKKFGYDDFISSNQIIRNGPQAYVLEKMGPRKTRLITFSENIAEISVYLALLLGGFVLMRSNITFADFTLVSVAATGIVVNAAICGIISGVAERYQGRVIWLIPLLAAVLAYHYRDRWIRFPARSDNRDFR